MTVTRLKPGAMDRPLERKRFAPLRMGVIATVVLAIASMTLFVYTRSGASTLRIEPTRLTTSVVEQGEFRDYYPVDGHVEPATTVYLDVQEGGRVDLGRLRSVAQAAS